MASWEKRSFRFRREDVLIGLGMYRGILFLWVSIILLGIAILVLRGCTGEGGAP
jgi:hypothetical protein